MIINWYPGHMVKSEIEIKKMLKITDVIIEILDSRAPISSRSAFLLRNKIDKPVIIILNKRDLSFEKYTNEWIDYFNNLGITTISVNSNSKNVKFKLIKNVKKILKEKILKWNNKKMIGKVPRLLVVGIPNVGKSSFVNNILGKNIEKSENRAGVTLESNWHSLNNEFEVCDTPGILFPKINDEVGEKLAFLGIIKDTLYDKEELCLKLIDYLKYSNLNSIFLKIFEKYIKNYNRNTELLKKDFLQEILNMDSNYIIELFAKIRKLFLRKNNLNISLASEIFLNDFKNGKFGIFTFERHKNIV